MLSHTTGEPGRIEAIKRLRVAVRAEDRVEIECEVRVRYAFRKKEIGMTPMRATVYISSGA
jgi:hypothetical protein